MNIGIDVRKLRDYGIGTHIRNVILAAIAMDPENRYFLFCNPEDSGDLQKNVVWITEKSSKYSVREHFSLANQAASHDVSLFHSPHYTLPLRLKCKTIVTVHDLIHFKFRQFFPAWKVKAAEIILKAVLKKADCILTVSETSKKDILEFFPGAEDKIEVIFNRLSPTWLEPVTGVKLEEVGIERDFLLYVGNFRKHKGIETLVAAYERLKDPPQLVLAGRSGEIDPRLLERIFSHERIRVLGFAEGALLHRLYADAILFVFPSLYEGFGYPPLEAMSCGTPVLSSDAPALREILGEGVEFFESGNADALREKLEWLILDDGKREMMRQAGRNKAMEYMSDESPRRLLELYRRLGL